MRLEFSDGTSVTENKDTDTFFAGFNHNLFLREACYQCKYCGTDRIADFTIADFWGVSEKRVTQRQLWLGVSLILVNSEKARALLPELEQETVLTKICPQEAIPFNQALIRPNTRPDVRSRFFARLECADYDFLVKQILWKFYLKRTIKKFLSRFLWANRHG